jgi:hypothetical protein
MSKGDKDRTTNKKAYDDNYDRIFRNAKTAQLQVTELNWDGDLEDEEVEECYHGIEGDTRNPEDYYKNIEVVTLPKQHMISRLLKKLNKKYPSTLKALKDKS